ncbi:MAG: DegV family protein [Bacteroidales bacterium]
MTFFANTSFSELDGRNLYYAFLAGARKVIEHQVELNKINVFPVKDGDTGTNLAATIRSVVDTLRPHRSFKVTADRIAEAVMMNARGNSGIIFAQFFYGLSNETGEYKSVTVRQFADSLRKSVNYVYEAVSKPVEGTMLTVIREFAEHIYASRNKFADFNQMLIDSYEVLKRSLVETKSKLEILRKNDVVDSGAKGFVLFFEGIKEFVASRNIKSLVLSAPAAVSYLKNEEIIPGKILFRYCTEAVIKNCSLEKGEIKKVLESYGDSVVIAGSDNVRRFHIHTNTPAELFNSLRGAGTIAFQKADDMIRHSQIACDRKWNIALVTDSTCDLPPEVFDRYQISMVPINLSFGENHYLDKVTIQTDQFYSMLNETREQPKSAQVNESTFTNLYSHLASHYDSIIAVHLSEKLSGTFYSSVKASKKISREFGKKITVLNSRSISGTLGLVVLRTAQAIEAGYTHDKVVEMADNWILNTRLFVSVKTLKFLVRGGRVSAVKGLLAKMLNINPIVTIDESGKVIVFDKATGQRPNMEKIIEYIRKSAVERNIWGYIVLHARNPEAAAWYTEKMLELTGRHPVSTVDISPVIGAHAGTGASAVALLYD